MSLFRFILFLIVGWYMLAFFGRYIFPWILRLLFNSAADRINKQMGEHHSRKHPSKKEGEVTISRKQTSSSGKTSADDDYVEFEEIP